MVCFKRILSYFIWGFFQLPNCVLFIKHWSELLKIWPWVYTSCVIVASLACQRIKDKHFFIVMQMRRGSRKSFSLYGSWLTFGFCCRISNMFVSLWLSKQKISKVIINQWGKMFSTSCVLGYAQCSTTDYYNYIRKTHLTLKLWEAKIGRTNLCNLQIHEEKRGESLKKEF